MNFSKLNPLNWFPKSSKIAKYLQAEFLKLSMADGKPGLSLADLIALAQRVGDANIPGLKAETKAEAVETWATGKFNNKIAGWAVGKLVQLAYLYAKERGVIK